MNPLYFETHFRTPVTQENLPAVFSIITAYATTGEQWTEAENNEADRCLEQQLRARGRWMQRIEGYSPRTTHAEPGWAVEMGSQEACDVGQAFHQDAIYFVTGDELWVSYCDARRELVRAGTFKDRVTVGPPSQS